MKTRIFAQLSLILMMGIPSGLYASAESPAPLETIQGKYIHTITIDQAIERMAESEAEKAKEQKPIDMTSRNEQPLSHPKDKEILEDKVLTGLQKLSDREAAMVFYIVKSYEETNAQLAQRSVESAHPGLTLDYAYMISNDSAVAEKMAHEGGDALIHKDDEKAPREVQSSEPDEAVRYLYDLAKKIVDHGLEEAKDYVKTKYEEVKIRHSEESLYDRVHRGPSIFDYDYTSNLIPEAFAEETINLSAQEEDGQANLFDSYGATITSSKNVHPYLKVMFNSEVGSAPHLENAQVEEIKQAQEAELRRSIKNAEYYKKVKENILEKVSASEVNNVDFSDRITPADEIQAPQTQ